MQVGKKAQGQDLSCGGISKKVALGLGHTSSRTKWTVRRSLERKVRQGARRACSDMEG